MNFEARHHGHVDKFFGVKPNELDLASRLLFLYHHGQIESLRRGSFLADYSFHPENIEQIFAQEPQLDVYIRESMRINSQTRRLVYCDGWPNPCASYASWDKKRLAQARRLREEYIMALLPLTLRVMYDGRQLHYQELSKCGSDIEAVFDYIRGVLLLHVPAASKFNWKPSLTIEDNARRFISYAQKCLHPAVIRSLDKKDDKLETSFCDIIPDNGEPAKDESERLEGIIYQRQADKPQRETARVELEEAISRFRQTLDPQSLVKFEAILERLNGGKSSTRIRREHGILPRFQSYLRRSGFYPRSSSAETTKGNRVSWFRQLPDIARSFSKLAYLLSPIQQKVIKLILEQTANGKKDGKDFKTLVREIATEIDSTPFSVDTHFWRAKQILLGQGDHQKQIISKQRIHQQKILLKELVRKKPTDGFLPGFSPTDSRVLFLYHEYPEMTLKEIAIYLGLGEMTVRRAIKKLGRKALAGS